MTGKGRQKLIMASALLLITAAALVIYIRYNPEENAFFPRCIFYSLTGLQCPGCGSQRAIHHLLHGHISQAFHFNPLLVASMPYILIWMIVFPLSKTYPLANKIRMRLYHGTAVYVVLVLIILFWIGRNI